jgi:DNA-binding NarL/FixJ family response regulator
MNARSLRLLLVDDQALFREALRTLLALQPDFQIVAEAANGEEAVALALRHAPDVILMDLRMPGLDGIEATRRLTAARSSARVIVLTTFDEDDLVFEALHAGAKGYLLKACSAETLYDAVRRTARGDSILDPSVAAKVISEFSRLSSAHARKPSPAPLAEMLSSRELDVLRLLAAGRSNKEIGAELHIVEGTVKNHMTNVLGKLGVLDRTQAALKARELGLI